MHPATSASVHAAVWSTCVAYRGPWDAIRDDEISMPAAQRLVTWRTWESWKALAADPDVFHQWCCRAQAAAGLSASTMRQAIMHIDAALARRSAPLLGSPTNATHPLGSVPVQIDERRTAWSTLQAAIATWPHAVRSRPVWNSHGNSLLCRRLISQIATLMTSQGSTRTAMDVTWDDLAATVAHRDILLLRHVGVTTIRRFQQMGERMVTRMSMTDLPHIIADAIGDLPDKHRQMVVARFGWQPHGGSWRCDQVQTLDEVGRSHGVTRERVRQCCQQALFSIQRDPRMLDATERCRAWLMSHGCVTSADLESLAGWTAWRQIIPLVDAWLATSFHISSTIWDNPEAGAPERIWMAGASDMSDAVTAMVRRVQMTAQPQALVTMDQMVSQVTSCAPYAARWLCWRAAIARSWLPTVEAGPWDTCVIAWRGPAGSIRSSDVGDRILLAIAERGDTAITTTDDIVAATGIDPVVVNGVTSRLCDGHRIARIKHGQYASWDHPIMQATDAACRRPGQSIMDAAWSYLTTVGPSHMPWWAIRDHLASDTTAYPWFDQQITATAIDSWFRKHGDSRLTCLQRHVVGLASVQRRVHIRDLILQALQQGSYLMSALAAQVSAHRGCPTQITTCVQLLQRNGLVHAHRDPQSRIWLTAPERPNEPVAPG